MFSGRTTRPASIREQHYASDPSIIRRQILIQRAKDLMPDRRAPKIFARSKVPATTTCSKRATIAGSRRDLEIRKRAFSR